MTQQNVYDFSELVDLAQTTATELMTQTLGITNKLMKVRS